MSNLCRGLAGLGHRVDVLTIDTDGEGQSLQVPYGTAVDQGGVATFFFPSSLGPNSVFYSKDLVNRLHQTVRQYDLVYASAIFQWLGLSVSWICQKQKIPLIIGPHGSLDKQCWKRYILKKTIFWHFFLKRTVRLASAIHYTTIFERKESAGFLDNLPNFVIPNSLDCHYFHPLTEYREQFRHKYGIPLNVPLIITVCRADPMKKVDLLIKALQLYPDYHLLVVGAEPGNLTDTWKNLATELNVSQRIFWPGLLKGEALLQAYAAADLFSLISDHENFGMVVIEALACGLPVLVNPEVGVWESIKSAEVGLAVEKNPAAIAGGLEHFLHNPSFWASCAQKSVAVAHNLFSQEKIGSLMAQAFADVLSGTRTPECHWQSEM
jgi:glycosyltransferase involved in cell wall biosynthesis